MEKIIITIRTRSSNIEAIGHVLAAAAQLKAVSQKIYLKTMRGSISVCLS
jgi:hypothetical protein